MEYFRRSCRLSIATETKLNSDDHASEAYYEEKLDGETNFISEVFFLTVAAHHYGLGATEVLHDDLAKRLHDLEKHVEQLQQDRERWINVGLYRKCLDILLIFVILRHLKFSCTTGTLGVCVSE